MTIPDRVIKKTEKLLNTKIGEITIPKSGYDHIVFTFKTLEGKKYICKANYNAVVDALVLNKIKSQNILIPVPKVISYSEEDKIAIFEFIEGKLLDTVQKDSVIKYLPRILEITSDIHKVKENLAGDFEMVYKGKGMSWKEFFSLKYKIDHPYYKWTELTQNKRFDEGLINGALQKINKSISVLAEPKEYSLLHSDIHGGNIIIDDNKVKALVDWSDANFGDPLYDFSRIRLFLINDNNQMLEMYHEFLNMGKEEHEIENLYYLGHVLRILFFGFKENLPEFIDTNYNRLKELMD